MQSAKFGRKPLILLLALAVVAAAAALAAASGSGKDELVVYNGRSHYGGEAAFKRFEQETGIKVKLFPGEATELFERLRNEGSETPADVLVTVDGANLWQAQDAGLLAPLDSGAVERNVPADLRDPKGEWTAISTRVRTIVRSTERVPEDEAPRTYEDLGDEALKGRVCLRTSNNIYNQSFVASMLAERGPRATEAMLRSWMANEPRILGSDVDVLEAIADGRCDIGLTNHYYLARELFEDPDFPVAPVWADQRGAGAHANISGAAVVAASDRKADARKLVEYLTEASSQRDMGDKGEFPANPAGQVRVLDLGEGWQDVKTDPIDVAAAGAQQKAAVQLMARVGWE
jgi:iron(III) transport system substrate-binding protein